MTVQNNPVLLGDEVYQETAMVLVAEDEPEVQVVEAEEDDEVEPAPAKDWTIRQYALLQLMTKGMPRPIDWSQRTVPTSLKMFCLDELDDKLEWLHDLVKVQKNRITNYKKDHKADLKAELEAEQQDQDDEDV